MWHDSRGDAHLFTILVQYVHDSPFHQRIITAIEEQMVVMNYWGLVSESFQLTSALVGVGKIGAVSGILGVRIGSVRRSEALPLRQSLRPRYASLADEKSITCGASSVPRTSFSGESNWLFRQSDR